MTDTCEKARRFQTNSKSRQNQRSLRGNRKSETFASVETESHQPRRVWKQTHKLETEPSGKWLRQKAKAGEIRGVWHLGADSGKHRNLRLEAREGTWSTILMHLTWPTKRMWARIVRSVCLIKRVENPPVVEPALRHRARRCLRSEPKWFERCGEKGKQKGDA